MSENPTVVLERTIPAPPDVVFAAWLDPKAIARFMCPSPNMRVGNATTDPRVGGQFLILMCVGERELPHQGVYEVIEPHKRLVFTWRSHHAGNNSRVTLTFERQGESETRLCLVHHGLDTPAAIEAHRQGWTGILDALATDMA